MGSIVACNGFGGGPAVVCSRLTRCVVQRSVKFGDQGALQPPGSVVVRLVWTMNSAVEINDFFALLDFSAEDGGGGWCRAVVRGQFDDAALDFKADLFVAVMHRRCGAALPVMIVKRPLNLSDLRGGQLGQRRLNFCNRAHGGNIRLAKPAVNARGRWSRRASEAKC